jgi:UDP-GlcNAc:undecaprenyl-phosphate GlcNAc-1-phosphate transferase
MGALFTPLVRNAAARLGALDHALSARKVHGRPVPRLGGIAIVAAFFAPLLALFFVSSEVGRRLWEGQEQTLALLMGGLGIAALGVYDDLKGSRARTKLVVQFSIAALMYWAGYRIDTIANPFGPELGLGWLGLPFTVLWIAGVTNAMNLIDGLDGLAGGVALIGVGTSFTIAAIHGEPLMLLFTASLAGAILGFLFYNFNPATIFMGDSGSMFLGFVLATTAIRSNQKSSTAVAIVVPILALGIPIADTLLAMGRRALRGAPLFSADRGHIHHRLMDRGLSHRQAVLVIYGGALVLGGGALLLRFANSRQSALVLLAVAGLSFLALRALGFVDLSKAQATLLERRRNLDVRAAVRKSGEALRLARTPDDVWRVVRDAAEPLGAVAVALHLGRLEGRPGAGPWSEGFQDAEPELLRARYGLVVERPGDDHIDLGWSDGREGVDRNTEIAVELLCDHVVVALDRIERTWGSAEPGKVVDLRR